MSMASTHLEIAKPAQQHFRRRVLKSARGVPLVAASHDLRHAHVCDLCQSLILVKQDVF